MCALSGKVRLGVSSSRDHTYLSKSMWVLRVAHCFMLQVARYLREFLIRRGHRVWFDEASLSPGESL